jgi:hypothetical protein
MSASTAKSKQNEYGGDSTDRFFYVAIFGVVLVGIAASVYRNYTATAPSMSTFLDLLTAEKTSLCSYQGDVLDNHERLAPNCLDYNGYRIVEGPTTVIYEIDVSRPRKTEAYKLVKVAELNTDAMKGLFNLKHVDMTYTIPAYQAP